MFAFTDNNECELRYHKYQNVSHWTVYLDLFSLFLFSTWSGKLEEIKFLTCCEATAAN